MNFSPIRHHSGFTLAELLIAILILSMVISLTYAAFNATFRVVENAESSSAYGERVRVAMQRITEDLESLHVGEGALFTGEQNSYGEWRGDSLRFTSRAHLLFHKDSDPAGYGNIFYTVEEDGSGEGLLLYRQDTAYLPGDQVEEGRGFLLCDGLREVAFSYLDGSGGEFESWDSGLREEGGEDLYPVAVRITLGFAQQNEEDGILRFSTLVAIPQGG